ncbi:membrane protein [Porphyromonas gulae]|uniref:Membrane protein n=1 Tax=Porphyromonas gulae TaxID=111105 RepID=A0A099WRB0_9PORP|nr:MULTISPECIES: DUF4492 domain-containing protein [Porphyromonas]KGL47063.1 membrane protein [Porphyromonas gulae]KGL54646.1 membrane protein [Porphyromonas sp. COT-052 OH4946]KGN69435.1 membrane protein [Porphyromonas gulae]KGN72230.1 membrane protein [Porphyromonas gulae]KGN73049.1 membrane protein [Porphyromonas gulae]
MTTTKAKRENLLMRIVRFYIDGFRNMKLGKTLWAIILIKLFIMFAILKVFFFPNFLKQQAGSDSAAKSEYVQQELIKRGINP